MTDRGATAAGRLDMALRGVILGMVFEKPASGLTATYRGGVIRVGNTTNGAIPSGTTPGVPVQEFVVQGSTKLFTASKDTYVYVDNTGTIQYLALANGAAKPSQATILADSEFLYKVVTNGTDITSVVRLWQQAPHGSFRTEAFLVDFVTANQATEIRSLPYGGIIRKIEATVNIALSGTDAGTATLSIEHDGVVTAVTGGVVTIPLSTALNTRLEVEPTAANVLQPGDALQMVALKTTTGGRAMVVVTIEEFNVSK